MTLHGIFLTPEEVEGIEALGVNLAAVTRDGLVALLEAIMYPGPNPEDQLNEAVAIARENGGRCDELNRAFMAAYNRKVAALALQGLAGYPAEIAFRFTGPDGEVLPHTLILIDGVGFRSREIVLMLRYLNMKPGAMSRDELQRVRNRMDLAWFRSPQIYKEAARLYREAEVTQGYKARIMDAAFELMRRLGRSLR